MEKLVSGGEGCGAKMMGGGSALEGSPYQSNGGEVNTSDMLKSGTSYVSYNLDSSKTFSGSYPEVVKGTHMCGGRRKRKGSRKNRSQRRKRNNRNNKSQRRNRNNRNNKSQRRNRRR